MTDVADQLELYLRDRHLDRMMQIAATLGDELVNATPSITGANSPYQIVFHCCGMLEWWTRSVVLGWYVDRDRAAEFAARGTVADLTARVDAVRRQFSLDLRAMDLDAPPRGDPGDYAGTSLVTDTRGVLLHVFEELAQHHGHLEMTRDLLVTASQ